MRITRKQIRKILKEAMEPMTQDYVLKSLNQPMTFGPNKGMTRADLAMRKVHFKRYNEAASAVMDALMIDDVSPEAEDELAQVLKNTSNLDQVALAAADWGNKHFRIARLKSQDNKLEGLSRKRWTKVLIFQTYPIRR